MSDREIRVIGSRASGQAKPFSDLDLAIMGDEPLSLQVRGALRDDFDESDLPFTVDLVEWATASEAFRRVILDSAATMRATPARLLFSTAATSASTFSASLSERRSAAMLLKRFGVMLWLDVVWLGDAVDTGIACRSSPSRFFSGSVLLYCW